MIDNEHEKTEEMTVMKLDNKDGLAFGGRAPCTRIHWGSLQRSP